MRKSGSACPQFPQESVGGPGGIHGVVAVAGEFDVEGAGVVCFFDGRNDVGEIHLAFTEHEMFVEAAAHVFYVDVEEFFFMTGEVVANVSVA